VRGLLVLSTLLCILRVEAPHQFLRRRVRRRKAAETRDRESVLVMVSLNSGACQATHYLDIVDPIHDWNLALIDDLGSCERSSQKCANSKKLLTEEEDPPCK